MIDSHVHLDSEPFDEDRDDVIERARAAGVEAIINIGIDVPTSEASIALSRRLDAIYPVFVAVGLHPTTVIEDLDSELEAITRLARSDPSRVVAIGEIGLDFHWDFVTPEDQRPRLARQLDLAIELDLPVVYHCREAIAELLETLEARERVPAGVFHCFEGGPAEAERALALGYHVSFAGNVTYKNASRLREAALVVPGDRLLLETDGPYLAPVPRRGKRNEPSFAILTRDFLADLRGETAEDLDAHSTAATKRLFRLERPA